MNSYREQARLLRLMAHPMRLEILAILRRSDECVCHLSAALKKPQPYVSQQLAILRREGLIADHNEGTYVYYGLGDGEMAGMLDAVLAALFADDQSEAVKGPRPAASCYCPKCNSTKEETS